MNAKYRIVEQHGVFRIEQLTEDVWFSFYDSFLWTFGRYKKKYYWSSAHNKPFETFEEAENYIPKLTPKYHEL